MIHSNDFCSTSRTMIRNCLCVVLVVGFGAILSMTAAADEPVLTGRMTYKVSDVGVGDVKISLRTRLNFYAELKQKFGNFNLLARKIGMDDRNWSEQSPLTGKFIDHKNEVEMEFTTPGAARNVKGEHWVLSLHGYEGCQLVTASASHVVLMSAESTDIGLGTMVIDVELPTGATNGAYDSKSREISYDFVPEVTSGTRPELRFTVDHKSTLMSSLAKNYSNPKFNYMWAARATATNTGDQVLNNYRVRFRLAEMSSWGSWQRTAKLYPGQTVVDPFFPIFDLEKVMTLNGSRPAVIEVEYEYSDADGKKCSESDSFPVQVLSRNEVVFSSLKPDEITGFEDQFDYAPALLTSMTTPADPVVQQLAGRINGMAAATYEQSIAASQSDDECLAFMSALFHFMKSNHVAYQSPRGMLTLGNHGQHIKYTRDVLRNRAGTCVDLAITWASVCEAAGLEPAVVLIPGHAFPAVRLPKSQRWIAIESTILTGSFKDAIKLGNEELAQAQKGDHYLIEITPLRNHGILGLDLPSVSEEYLTNLNYTFDAELLERAKQDQQGNRRAQNDVTQTQADSNDTGDQVVTMNDLGGKWGGYGVLNGIKIWVGISLDLNGRFEVLLQSMPSDGAGNREIIRGNWGVQNGNLCLTKEDGERFQYPFDLSDNELQFCIFGGNQPVTLNRKG